MPDDIPTAQVMSLRSQGLNNNQIVQALQRDGYSLTQIYDAMNQADVKSSVQPSPMEGPAPQGYGYEQQPAMAGGRAVSTDMIQPLVESIVEEKWQELVVSVSKISEWKDKTEIRINAIEQAMNMLKADFDKLHESILEKVGEYDRHITDVGVEIQALEKVFQKILPGFMENIGELSRITKDLRDVSGKNAVIGIKKKI